jgi:choline-sulfatase
MDAKNLLILMSDEHDPRYTGCYGHPFVQTPNIDRLAESGTRFETAYTPCPICVPARASFATGRPVHETGCWDNAHGYDGSISGWGQQLIDKGHRVESIGKLHYKNEEAPTGFSRQHQPMHLKQGVGTVWGAIKEPFADLPEPWRMFNRIGPGVSNYNLYDRGSAGAACEWLKKRADAPEEQPWVLYVGFVAPHYPLVVPSQFFDMYPLDNIPLPKLHPRDGYEQHPWVAILDGVIGQDHFFDTDEERLRALTAYMGLCSFVDAEVGLVLDALQDNGFKGDTRVIYTSDHGDNLGARGLWGKSVLYEESTRIPMIVSGPDVPSGKTSKTPVTLLDIHQTAVTALGYVPHDADTDMSGRSLIELATATDDTERLVASEYHAMGAPTSAFMLRQGNWKYHYYEGYEPELFNIADDPEEIDDQAANPAVKFVLDRFEEKLRAQLDPAAIDRQAKDDLAALIESYGGREAAIDLGRSGATPVPGQKPE